MDLVLVNDKIKPAICKVLDYKENLYKRFISDILKKDYEGTFDFILNDRTKIQPNSLGQR